MVTKFLLPRPRHINISKSLSWNSWIIASKIIWMQSTFAPCVFITTRPCKLEGEERLGAARAKLRREANHFLSNEVSIHVQSSMCLVTGRNIYWQQHWKVDPWIRAQSDDVVVCESSKPELTRTKWSGKCLQIEKSMCFRTALRIWDKWVARSLTKPKF